MKKKMIVGLGLMTGLVFAGDIDLSKYEDKVSGYDSSSQLESHLNDNMNELFSELVIDKHVKFSQEIRSIRSDLKKIRNKNNYIIKSDANKIKESFEGHVSESLYSKIAKIIDKTIASNYSLGRKNKIGQKHDSLIESLVVKVNTIHNKYDSKIENTEGLPKESLIESRNKLLSWSNLCGSDYRTRGACTEIVYNLHGLASEAENTVPSFITYYSNSYSSLFGYLGNNTFNLNKLGLIRLGVEEWDNDSGNSFLAGGKSKGLDFAPQVIDQSFHAAELNKPEVVDMIIEFDREPLVVTFDAGWFTTPVIIHNQEGLVYKGEKRRMSRRSGFGVNGVYKDTSIFESAIKNRVPNFRLCDSVCNKKK